MKRNIRSCILIAMAFFAMNAPALAQTAYPVEPIRMVVPFSPGGTSDTLARILGQKFTEAWGQQVVVD
jgi:tripartite-type tricarboxylate transporter receptor subunit TctC